MGAALIITVVVIIGLIWLLLIGRQEKGYARRSFRPKKPAYIFVLDANNANVIFYTINIDCRKIFYEIPRICFFKKGDWLILHGWVIVRIFQGKIDKVLEKK